MPEFTAQVRKPLNDMARTELERTRELLRFRSHIRAIELLLITCLLFLRSARYPQMPRFLQFLREFWPMPLPLMIHFALALFAQRTRIPTSARSIGFCVIWVCISSSSSSSTYYLALFFVARVPSLNTSPNHKQGSFTAFIFQTSLSEDFFFNSGVAIARCQMEIFLFL